jgi:hypothetical protein
MVLLQEFIGYIRRIAEQAEKGARYLSGLTENTLADKESAKVEETL